MAFLKISAPWYTLQKKVKAIFAADKDIHVNDLVADNDNDCYILNIDVRNHEKYVALDRTLTKEFWFGNIEVRIILFDEENARYGNDIAELYGTVFNGNGIFKDVRVTTDQTGTSHSYVRFEPKVVQFFNDDLSDYNGNWTGLAEDIAKELFQGDANRGVFFCTAAENENSSEESKIEEK